MPQPVRHVEFRELADKQVEPAVIVVVEPHRARAPTRRRNAGLLRHIRECAVAVIAVQNIASTLRHIKVRKAIAVVVPHRDAHAIAAARHARLSPSHR